MTVRIEVHALVTYELPESILWPDGENQPTARKAATELRSDVNGADVNHLLCHDVIDHQWVPLKVVADRIVAVEVDAPNPAYAGDDVMFGDPPARTVVTRENLR